MKKPSTITFPAREPPDGLPPGAREVSPGVFQIDVDEYTEESLEDGLHDALYTMDSSLVIRCLERMGFKMESGPVYCDVSYVIYQQKLLRDNDDQF